MKKTKQQAANLDRPQQEHLDAKTLKLLQGFDTPTICNALEIITPERRLHGYTVEPLSCIYPSLPPMVG